MPENKMYDEAYKALVEFHQTADLEALRTKLHAMELPDSINRDDFVEWIDRNIAPAKAMEDPRQSLTLSLTSSASILYGIEP